MIAGISSGFLGIGGAIIAIPILRYMPDLLGFPSISLHVITGITSLQTTFSTGAASYFHRKTGNINLILVKYTGIGVAIGAITGSITSKFLSENILLILYALFISFAGVLLILKKEKPLDVNDITNPIHIKSNLLLVVFGIVVGFIAGALGVAGSVVIIPLINTIFSIPIKICISSGTAIAFIASTVSFLGKSSTGQFELISAIIISVSSILGAFIGAYFNKKASPKFLRYALLFIIALTLLRVLVDLLGNT